MAETIKERIDTITAKLAEAENITFTQARHNIREFGNAFNNQEDISAYAQKSEKELNLLVNAAALNNVFHTNDSRDAAMNSINDGDNQRLNTTMVKMQERVETHATLRSAADNYARTFGTKLSTLVRENGRQGISYSNDSTAEVDLHTEQYEKLAEALRYFDKLDGVENDILETKSYTAMRDAVSDAFFSSGLNKAKSSGVTAEQWSKEIKDAASMFEHPQESPQPELAYQDVENTLNSAAAYHRKQGGEENQR